MMSINKLWITTAIIATASIQQIALATGKLQTPAQKQANNPTIDNATQTASSSWGYHFEIDRAKGQQLIQLANTAVTKDGDKCVVITRKIQDPTQHELYLELQKVTNEQTPGPISAELIQKVKLSVSNNAKITFLKTIVKNYRDHELDVTKLQNFTDDANCREELLNVVGALDQLGDEAWRQFISFIDKPKQVSIQEITLIGDRIAQGARKTLISFGRPQQYDKVIALVLAAEDQAEVQYAADVNNTNADPDTYQLNNTKTLTQVLEMAQKAYTELQTDGAIVNNKIQTTSTPQLLELLNQVEAKADVFATTSFAKSGIAVASGQGYKNIIDVVNALEDPYEIYDALRDIIVALAELVNREGTIVATGELNNQCDAATKVQQALPQIKALQLKIQEGTI